jgi:3-hydroxyisobutyrate dehydrogenase
VNLAFIGLGNMGAGMARRLLDTGHRVSVYNRTNAKADALVGHGARLARTPKEACERVDAVISMVSDDAASRAVWLGGDGILAANLPPSSLAIECSTLSYDWVTELAALVAARGLCYIDAPVTGLPAAAARGELTLLVGAEPQDLERARPLLLALCERIFRFGTVGTGTAYKLIINMIGAVQIASAAEGLAIAQRAGLDLALVAEAVATSQAASPQVVRNTRRMVDGDHDRNVVFTTALRLKDAQYALRLARELGIGAPFGELAESGLRELCERGRSQLNESSIFELAASRETSGKPGGTRG